MHGSPYEGVLGRGLFGASQDANVTNGRFGGVAGNELDAESPLPEGLLLWGGRSQHQSTQRRDPASTMRLPGRFCGTTYVCPPSPGWE